MKLLSLNVEGMRHCDRVQALLERERPDIICFQEANQHHKEIVESCGHTTILLPTVISTRDDENLPEGLLFASHVPFQTETHFYFQPNADSIMKEDMTRPRETNASALLYAEVSTKEGVLPIITTHFTWTPDGYIATLDQQEDMQTLLEYTKQKPPHLMCGDFNIPRHHNPLYEALTKRYTDCIPETYTSSLDKEFHRRGPSPDHLHLFTDFMVDYIFSQSPIQVSNVRLEFGVSDHAALIADISV